MILLKNLLDTMLFDTPFIVKGMTTDVPGFTFETERMIRFNAFSKLTDSILGSRVITISIRSYDNQPVMMIAVDHV